MQTKREYAASLGLAQLGVRGRLSAAANQAILDAQKNGMRFAETAKPITRPSITTTEYDVDLGEVRKWAKAKGYPVSERGRIASVLIAEYAKETGKKALTPERKAEKKAAKAVAPKPEKRGKPAVHNTYENYGITVTEVRAWARENGLNVNPRGMIATEIVQQYIQTKNLSPISEDEKATLKAKRAEIAEAEKAAMQEKTEKRLAKRLPKQEKKVVANTPSTPAIVKRVEPKRVRPENVGWTYAERKAGDPQHISEPLVAVTTCGDCSKGVGFCSCATGPMAPKYLGRKPLLLVRP